MCAYLNRHWVKREIDEGRKHVYEVYNVSKEIYRHSIPRIIVNHKSIALTLKTTVNAMNYIKQNKNKTG